MVKVTVIIPVYNMERYLEKVCGFYLKIKRIIIWKLF